MEHYNHIAYRNEQLVEQCLKQIHMSKDAEEALQKLLQYLGETLQCDRVYVFEDMDRQYIENTYEWCKNGVVSGIRQLPYLAKKDLSLWHDKLSNGENIIEPHIEHLKATSPLIYNILSLQHIHSIILSPLMFQDKVIGLLGADNPPPENMEHISVLFSVLAYFVSSLVSQRDLTKLRESKVFINPKEVKSQSSGKTILLLDDSIELLKLNERILSLQGYYVISAKSIQKARQILLETQIDIAILDVDLPDGNGVDFCKEIDLEIPIIFLTARSDEQNIKDELKSREYMLLKKPYQLEELQIIVTQADKKVDIQRKEDKKCSKKNR